MTAWHRSWMRGQHGRDDCLYPCGCICGMLLEGCFDIQPLWPSAAACVEDRARILTNRTNQDHREPPASTSAPLDKRGLSERDICTKFITPAVASAGWDLLTQVREELDFTKGRITVRGKLVSRGKGKRTDYVLYIKPNIPLAVIEAKDNSHEIGAGMQQARRETGRPLRLLFQQRRLRLSRPHRPGCRARDHAWPRLPFAGRTLAPLPPSPRARILLVHGDGAAARPTGPPRSSGACGRPAATSWSTRPWSTISTPSMVTGRVPAPRSNRGSPIRK